MRELTTEAKVGLLVIVIIGALLWATRVTGDRVSGPSGKTFYATFDSASGLTKATRVEIAGVPVGEIEEISREGGKAKVRMRVAEDVSLPLDSYVTIVGKGILGDKAIKLVPGDSESGEPLRNGDTIPTGPPEADFDAIIKRVDAIAQDVQAVTGSLREAIGTAEGQAKLQGMVDDLSEFADNLAQVSTDNREALNEIVENMRQMSERLNQVIDNSGQDLDETFVEIKKAAVKLDSSLASIDSVAAKIDRGEGTLGRLVNDDDTIEALNEAIGGVNDYLERINRVRIYVNYQGEFQVARDDDRDGSTKNAFLFRIQPHEDYGYIVGVSDDIDGAVTRKITTQWVDADEDGEVDDGEVLRTETHKRKDTFLLTAQVFKRYGPVAGRIGLKDGTGGVGADLWLFRDKLKVSADAFQWYREREGEYGATKDENPRLKVQARYDLLKHVYVVGGGDDLISNYDRRAYFVGGGFEFNDDDLKFLMGSLPVP